MLTQFEVAGMSCGHCVAAVTHAIKERDAQAHVEVDLPAGRIAIESTLPQDALAEAIDAAGYAVTNRA